MAAGFNNAGITYALGVAFPPSGGGGPSQLTAFYLGLINNSPSPTFNGATDVLSAHAGWTESTAYSGNRPAWTNGAVSGLATTNSSVVIFSMTGSVTVYGLFLCSVASGNSATATLVCTAAFSGGTQAVASADQLQTTLTISAASG